MSQLLPTQTDSTPGQGFGNFIICWSPLTPHTFTVATELPDVMSEALPAQAPFHVGVRAQRGEVISENVPSSFSAMSTATPMGHPHPQVKDSRALSPHRACEPFLRDCWLCTAFITRRNESLVVQIAGGSEEDPGQAEAIQLIRLYNPKWGTLDFGVARSVALTS